MDITKREITKIAREVNKFTIRTLRMDGIGAGELDVIHVVRKNPGITQSEICKILGMDKGAIAKQTANLVSKGYLTKKENLKDKRSNFLYATEKSNRLKKSKAYIEEVFYEWLVNDLSDTDKEEFVRILDKMYKKCKEEGIAQFPNVIEKMECTLREEI